MNRIWTKQNRKKNVNKTVKQYGLLISIEHDCDDNDNNEKDTWTTRIILVISQCFFYYKKVYHDNQIGYIRFSK